jgi:hypothetical protein
MEAGERLHGLRALPRLRCGLTGGGRGAARRQAGEGADEEGEASKHDTSITETAVSGRDLSHGLVD